MVNIIGSVGSIVQNLGPLGVFLAGILEQVVVPIPSPIVPMGGGFFLVEKGIAFWEAVKNVFFKVAVPFSLGSTLGSTMVFLLAYFGGAFLINKFSRYIEISWDDIERFKKKYFKGKATDELLIFAFMAIPVMPSVLISGVSGAIRVRMFDFYLFTFLGLLVRGIVLGTLGWWAGEAYQEMANGFNRAEDILLLVAGLVVIGFLVFGYLKRDKLLGKASKKQS